MLIKIAQDLLSRNLTDDPILESIISKGYENYLNSVTKTKFNHVPQEKYNEMAGKFIELCEFKDFNPVILEKVIEDTQYATTFYAIYYNPETQRSKFIAILGQKQYILAKETDWLVIEFKEEFYFFPGYSVSYGFYGAFLELYNGKTQINEFKDKEVTEERINYLFQLLFINR